MFTIFHLKICLASETSINFKGVFDISQSQLDSVPSQAKLSYALVLPDFGSMGRPVIKLKRPGEIDQTFALGLTFEYRFSEVFCIVLP